MLRRAAAIGVAAVAMVVAATGRAASGAFVPCHGTSGVLCGTVSVPLDPSSTVPGSVPLAVEELPADGKPRGVMVLLAGGPGQASAVVFDLSRHGFLWQSLFPGYTLVAFDPRGTGNSGFLGCALGGGAPIDPQQVMTCGDALGPGHAFYTTANNAEDMDAVRQALGVDKLAVWGTSYGTKLALAYALAHPDHVERLLLDSVLPVTGPDPLGLDLIQGIPLGLSSLCSSAACRSLAPDLVSEVASLANRAAVQPLKGKVLSGVGVWVPVSLNGVTLLSIVTSADLDPGIRAELPSAVAAATAGRPRALLRLAGFVQGGLAAADTSFSTGLFLATTCTDGRFPWQPDATLPDRQQVLAAAIAALPAGATGPFGTWATQIGSAGYCLDWPSPAGNAPLAAGPLPDVPVLALSGGLDMRTPTSEAAAVVTQFPHGHLLVVPGVGHSVLTADPSGCAERAVRLWLASGSPPARCAVARQLVADVGRIPATIGAAPPVPGLGGLRGRTLSATRATVADAVATWLTGSGRSIAGLDGGMVSSTGVLSMALTGYSDVLGLALTGRLTLTLRPSKNGPLVAPAGSLRVAGARAAHGVIRLATNGSVKASWTRPN